MQFEIVDAEGRSVVVDMTLDNFTPTMGTWSVASGSPGFLRADQGSYVIHMIFPPSFMFKFETGEEFELRLGGRLEDLRVGATGKGTMDDGRAVKWILKG